jgi:hypothetical protein
MPDVNILIPRLPTTLAIISSLLLRCLALHSLFLSLDVALILLLFLPTTKSDPRLITPVACSSFIPGIASFNASRTRLHDAINPALPIEIVPPSSLVRVRLSSSSASFMSAIKLFLVSTPANTKSSIWASKFVDRGSSATSLSSGSMQKTITSVVAMGHPAIMPRRGCSCLDARPLIEITLGAAYMPKHIRRIGMGKPAFSALFHRRRRSISS